MNARTMLTAGLRRGWTELIHVARSGRDLAGYLLTPLSFVLVGTMMDRPVPGAGVTAAQLMFTGAVSFIVVQIGLLNLPQILVTEREDGTLLRLRATPGGLGVYLIGKAVLVAATVLASVGLLLAAGMLTAGLALPATPADWATLAWVLTLGLVSVVPLGAMLGALLPNAREAIGVLTIPVMSLALISGVLFPTAGYPELVLRVADAFPLRWIALGVRSALLPDSMLAAETVTGWQHPVILVVLAAWTVGGMLLALPLLRRMTRRQSGSRLDARRGQLADRVA